MTAPAPRPPLEDLLGQRILVLDGGMGTMLQAANLTADDFGGPDLEGCNENLVLTRPDVIRGIHATYFEAGADLVETNTFGATRLVLDEYALGDKARAINLAAATLAREAADAATLAAPDKPRYVAGSIGPTTKALSLTGGTTFDELVSCYHEQAAALIDGGVDCLLIETSQDGLNVKAAGVGVEDAFKTTGKRVPVMLSATIEPMGTMLAGQGIEAFYAGVEHLKPLTVGLNCATGPEFMTDHLRSLSAAARSFVHVYPNAGLPDADGHYEETAETLAAKMKRFVDEGLVNIVGGCCGTTPEHVRALAALVAGAAPRVPPVEAARRHLSGVDYHEVDLDNRPVLVGERTNVIGSRKFKRLVAESKWEEASEVGRAQVKNGAQVVDVCLADPDRDESVDMATFLPELVKKVRAPIMIDSTDAQVIEEALKMVQGKAIINSINLEDGEERFEAVVPLAKKYGAAVVVGCIDEDPEQGMAVTRERKLAVAQRSFDLLTGKYGLPAEDIIFDPLVFPCGTGDENYAGSAVETIEGTRLLTQHFPRCATILGISNVSFGLPKAGREVLNSVFLYHTTKAGLTYAIVNTQLLERYPSIPEEDRKACEDLLWNRGDDPIATFADHFKDRDGAVSRKSNPRDKMTLEERLADCILEGSKEGLHADLDEALKARTPLEIINGPLMTGMDEVGRLFNDNQLIVAEVLQSAEAMKAAVAHLEPHMEKADTASKGKILLATVKGDVHDIGKNLVDIILSNNGYEVVNLGIKVAPEALVAAAREHQPDMIGLSGLLVKSAQQMTVTARDLKAAGIDAPLLVGGAALTKKFTGARIAPEYGAPTFYAKDAMNGLSLANHWRKDREAMWQDAQDDYARIGNVAAAAARTAPARVEPTPVRRDVPRPTPPTLTRQVARQVDPRHVWDLVNPTMLYGKHLGLRGNLDKLLADKDERATKLHAFIEELKRDILARERFDIGAVWQWFPAASDGDELHIYDEAASQVIETFRFPRQSKSPARCISDWVHPLQDGKPVDHVGMFALTAGPGVRDIAESWKNDGEYLKSHAVQALALETAEAYAETLHRDLRAQWGIPDAPELSAKDLFQARYQGIRVSFGYPACPDLEDQEKLFRLLRPDDIGLSLTDGHMMDPEASVSALVFHHPEAGYFDAR